jgi:hypothetical protein
VGSHRLGRKIYQLEVLKVPSGIIFKCYNCSAVQIKRSRLSSVSTLITCRGYPDTRQVGVPKDPKHVTLLYTKHTNSPYKHQLINAHY